MMQKTNGPFFKYIAAVLLFGTNGIVASQIALSSYEIVLTRTLLGSLFLVAVFVMTRQRLQCWRNKRHPFYLAVSGIAMGLNWMFLYEAYTQIGVSLGILACYCGPVIVMMLSPVIFREKMTAPKLLGFLAVLTGMFFVNAQALADGKTPWGLFCGIMSAVMYAVMVIFNKKAASITGIENAMWQLLISFGTVAVFVGVKQGFAMEIAPADVAPILLLGIVNTGIGCYLYFSSIGALPVQTVAICGYLEPLAAIVFSALLLGEKLDAIQIVGAGLILGGAAFGELMGQREPAFGRAERPGSAQWIRDRRSGAAPCRCREVDPSWKGVFLEGGLPGRGSSDAVEIIGEEDSRRAHDQKSTQPPVTEAREQARNVGRLPVSSHSYYSDPDRNSPSEAHVAKDLRQQAGQDKVKIGIA